jgi:hypothetical protein
VHTISGSASHDRPESPRRRRSDAEQQKHAGCEQADLDEEDEDAVADASDDLLAGPGAEQGGRGERDEPPRV